MTTIIKKSIDSSIEDKIAIGSILSSKFLSEIHNVYDPAYIKADHVQKIVKWSLEYFEYYEKAPKQGIKDIYDLEKANLSVSEGVIIEEFLTRISKQFVEEEREINDDYYVDHAMKYFQKRELELLFSTGQKCLEVGRVEQAEGLLERYRKVMKKTLGWYNPFSLEEIVQTYQGENDGIMQFPGAFGQLIGPLERGWLIAVLGAFKRGKTNWMLEFAVQALLHRLKVVFISLEMKKSTINDRIYRRLTGSSKEEEFIYPTFDCLYNQTGECQRKERENTIQLVDSNGKIPIFDSMNNYKVCTSCRKQKGKTKDYKLAIWFEVLKRPLLTHKSIVKTVRGFEGMYGDNLRIIVFPRGTASFIDIKKAIDILEQAEEFIPDVIIIDYIKIIKHGPTVEEIDNLWVQHGGLAGEKHCIVMTGDQGTRSSIYKTTMEQSDWSGWIGALGHIDIGFAINQTKEEKKEKIMRINLLGHRHKEFNEDDQCVVLQQLTTGQIMLDSEEL